MKNVFFYLIISAYLSLLYACGSIATNEFTPKYSISLDSIMLPLDNFSGRGRLAIYKDTILYLDELYAEANLYSLQGDSIGRRVNRGRNFGEIPQIHNYLYLPDSGHLLLEDWNFYLYDKAWNYRRKFRIDWNGSVGYNLLLTEPEKYVDLPDMYEFAYIHNQLEQITDSTLLLNIDTEHERLNAFATEAYYEKARILAEVSMHTGKVKRVFGNKSDKYQEYRFIPHLIGHYYDFDGTYLYVGFEPDEKIYQYTTDFKLIHKFGVAGIGMNTDYTETNTVETAYDAEAFTKSRTTEGYYTHIRYFPQLQWLFRTYTLGGVYNEQNQNPQRLQVYENQQLVADVLVPMRFRVLAYIAPYFYAEGILDEANGRLGVYRFTLENQLE